MAAKGITLPIIYKSDDSGLKKAASDLNGFGKTVAKIGGLIAGAFAIRGIVNFAKESVLAAEAVEVANNRIAAVAKTTGLYGLETNKVTNSLIKFAEANELRIATDAEVIKGVQAQLLSFKQLAKSAGVTGGSFERATLAAFDMAEVMGMDANSAALQLAKALEDPVRGLTALRRSGTIFTAEQQTLIKTLVESGNILEAQNIILTEVESQYGGAAEATASWSERLTLAFDNVKEALGAALTPAFEAFAMYLVNEVIPVVQTFFEDDFPRLLEAGREILDRMGPVFLDIGNAIRDAFDIDRESSILQGLLDKLAGLSGNQEFQDFVFAIGDGFLQLLPSLIELVPLTLQLAETAVPLLVEVLPDLIYVVGELLPLVVDLVGAFTSLFQWGNDVAASLPGWASEFAWLFDPIQKATDGFVKLRNAIKSAWEWLQRLGGKSTAGFADTAAAYANARNSLNLGGARAMGGPVSAGLSYLVGERGPELFTPSQSGSIIPNNRISGSGATYNITVNAGVGDPVRIGEQVVNMIKKYERASGPVFASA